MSLWGDLNELRDQWRSLSPLARVIAATLFVVSLLSVSSIADSIYSFRGFLGNAVAQYRGLTSPLVGWLDKITPADVTQANFEFLTLLTILIGINVRVQRRHLHDSKQRRRVLAIGLGLLLFAYAMEFLVGSETRSSDLLYAAVMFPVACIGLWSLGFLFRGSPEHEEGVKRSQSVFLNMFLQSMLVYLVIAILAAVSEGLTRPLT